MTEKYIRPKTKEEACALLIDPKIDPVIIMGGAFKVNFQEKGCTLIDLQALKLDHIKVTEDLINVGGMVTLQAIADHDIAESGVRTIIQLETGRNVRNSMTIAGHLLASDGRSLLTTALLALDVSLFWGCDDKPMQLSDYLTQALITTQRNYLEKIQWQSSYKIAFDYVARTPLDRPIVCAVITEWPDKRIRIALGGYGKFPILAYEGYEKERAALSAKHAYQNAGDEWASADYRQEMAQVLSTRCLMQLDPANFDKEEV